MKLESQVTSLELSKRLHELGVKQESLFYWTEKDDYSSLNYNESVVLLKDNLIYYTNEFNSYSAFTASELLELLPHEISMDGIYYTYLMSFKKNNEYEIRYDSMRLDKITQIEFGNALSNALAKMLIHLIENNLLEIKS